MKKLLSLLLVCCTALFGCSSSWDKTCTYKDNQQEITALLKADKDGNLTKFKTTTTITSGTEAEAIIIEGSAKAFQESFKDISGMENTVKRNGTTVTVVMEVDMEKLSKNSPLPEGITGVGLTLDEMVNLLEEEQGCTCK